MKKKWKSLNWEIGASRSCGGDFRRLCFIWKFRNAGPWLADRGIDFREPDQSQFVIDCSTRCSKNGALGLRTKSTHCFLWSTVKHFWVRLELSSKVRQDHTTRTKSQTAKWHRPQGWAVVNLDTGERIKQIFTMKSTTTDDLVCKSPKTVIFRAILKIFENYTVSYTAVSTPL